MKTYPVVQQGASPDSYRFFPNRPIACAFAHHTAGREPFVAKPGASCHEQIAQDGTVYLQVPEGAAAHTVLKTDLMRPSQLLRCPDGSVSDANYCGYQFELIYAPQWGDFPTLDQHLSLNWRMKQLQGRRAAVLPLYGHGQVQSDKVASEPTGVDWQLAGFGPYVERVGRFLTEGGADVENPTPIETIKEELEKYYGVGVNMDTAIMKFVAEAYQEGQPPYGNWRGPARWAPAGSGNPGGEQVGVGEYEVIRDGVKYARHRFTAGIVEYNTVTGGLGWIELINHPEEIDAL